MPASPRSSAPACCRTPISPRLQIPNLFRRLLAEGALNSAFVPMWIRIREESGPEGTRRFGEQVLGAMARALGLVAVLCLLGAPLVVHVIAPGFASTGERFPSRSLSCGCRCPMSRSRAWSRSRRPRSTPRAGSRPPHSASWCSMACCSRRRGAAPAARRGVARGCGAARRIGGRRGRRAAHLRRRRLDARPRNGRGGSAFSSSPAVRRFLVQALPGCWPAASRSSS